MLQSWSQCSHSRLSFVGSSQYRETEYSRPQYNNRIFSSGFSLGQNVNWKANEAGRSEDADIDDFARLDSSFPAPLILPGDDLDEDPEYPAQDTGDWLNEPNRRELSTKRKVVYVVPPPECESDVEFIQEWSSGHGSSSSAIPRPKIEHILDYLTAYYHGLPAKLLDSANVRFMRWDSDSLAKKLSKKPPYIGLASFSDCIRIRTRPSKDGLFPCQLNLDDLLDAAIGLLPQDAYALLFLVEHDLYESKDDEFVCGRAYGGNGVAVVSMARYHPMLDDRRGEDRSHAWPASHCEQFLESCCEAGSNGSRSKKRIKLDKEDKKMQASSSDASRLAALSAAVEAHKSLPYLDSSATMEALTGLWLGRICRTASHELGHCFGIDHCVYYACGMQGSASLAEDARQPPYLCPIDLEKLLTALASEKIADRALKEKIRKDRYDALLAFTTKHDHVHLFRAFGAWIKEIRSLSLSH